MHERRYPDRMPIIATLVTRGGGIQLATAALISCPVGTSVNSDSALSSLPLSAHSFVYRARSACYCLLLPSLPSSIPPKSH